MSESTPIAWQSEGPETQPGVSKSQLKRDAQAARTLAAELISLSGAQLGVLPLSDTLRESIRLAHGLKREGLRRQLNHIAKLLRIEGVAAIRAADMAARRPRRQINSSASHLELVANELLSQGEGAITSLAQQGGQIERRRLRSLVRAAHEEAALGLSSRAYQTLIGYLKRELGE